MSPEERAVAAEKQRDEAYKVLGQIALVLVQVERAFGLDDISHFTVDQQLAIHRLQYLNLKGGLQ